MPSLTSAAWSTGSGRRHSTTFGLLGALRESAAQYSAKGLNVSVKAPEGLPPLSAAVEVAAYRIAQEALTNVARHAGASECTVYLGIEETSVLDHRPRRAICLSAFQHFS